jgi:hypothetical protein
MFSEKNLKKLQEFGLTREKLLEAIDRNITYLLLNNDVRIDLKLNSAEKLLVWMVYAALVDFKKDFQIKGIELQAVTLHEYLFYFLDSVPNDLNSFNSYKEFIAKNEFDNYHRTSSSFIADYFSTKEVETLLSLMKNKFLNGKVETETKHPSDENF